MMQLSLFSGDTPLERAFWQFHHDNLAVYRLFDRFAQQVIAAGHAHYSARAIFHRIRWHTSVETRGDEYRLNNNHSPFYARLWERDHPQHAGFFRHREAAADDMAGGMNVAA